jgi:hypothetical protein
MAARHWLALGVVAGAAAFAGPPPSPPSPPSPPAPPPDAARAATPAVDAPAVAAPDDDFIEFLGRDDVGDAALWAFLKKPAQRKDSPPPQPQDAKQ